MKRSLLLLMIFPLCLMLFNNTAFRHWHLLPDGQMIEHAHPFQSAPDKSGPGHQHTEREIMLFMVISDSPVILMFPSLLIAVYRTLEDDLRTLHPVTFNTGYSVIHKLLRAPPTSVI